MELGCYKYSTVDCIRANTVCVYADVREEVGPTSSFVGNFPGVGDLARAHLLLHHAYGAHLGGFWLFFPQLLRNGVDVKLIREYQIFIEFVKHSIVSLKALNLKWASST
ncbi:hypothetical protein BVC80_1785g14 [Macleaya cordata]|uniref:Uncharacterized protein n=1 Tax=Macleaya cordata TaxID=56857 RepID=A0A200QFJ0_MACCD|nr:hypothetical protein BVC80_1785g14 [Macleaya cordata]